MSQSTMPIMSATSPINKSGSKEQEYTHTLHLGSLDSLNNVSESIPRAVKSSLIAFSRAWALKNGLPAICFANLRNVPGFSPKTDLDMCLNISIHSGIVIRNRPSIIAINLRLTSFSLQFIWIIIDFSPSSRGTSNQIEVVTWPWQFWKVFEPLEGSKDPLEDK